MTKLVVDPDVKLVARHFGLDPQLIQAVVRAEGNILRAVQCSYPEIANRAQALDITCRSAVHAMGDFLVYNGIGRSFVSFWGAKWAPVGAANDPTALNANWPKNVAALWLGEAPDAKA